MSAELAEIAFMAGVPRWTDELAKAYRDKRYADAEKLALKLNHGFGLVAAVLAEKKEVANGAS